MSELAPEVANVLASDDMLALLDLCKAGRLFEVARWIEAGKSVEVRPDCRRPPLHVAVESGFYSLVELLARHAGQRQKNSALECAVSCRRVDLVELLLAHGADLRAVPLKAVLFTWDPNVIRLFLARGGDAITDEPFAHAFCERVRTTVGPYAEYKRSHPELATALQTQADIALRHHCHARNLKWTSLMMWAGADPRTRGPCFQEDYKEAPDEWQTALEYAAYAEDLKLLKILKPDRKRDDLGALLKNAALFSHTGTVKYLLSLGADPNDKLDGTSSAVATCFEQFGWRPDDIYGAQNSRWHVSDSLECLTCLIDHGARWVPVDRWEMNHVRRALLECEPRVTVEVVRMFAAHNVCTIEVLRNLVRTQRMKEHLKPMEWHMARLKLPFWERPKKMRTGPPMAMLLDQFDRCRLYEQVWNEPMRTVAKSYGMSDVWLAKVCRWLRVPIPGRGYWAKRSAGHQMPKPPDLPTLRQIEDRTR